MYKKAEAEMAKFFHKDEYGGKNYDKDGNEIIDGGEKYADGGGKTLAEKNKGNMLKHFKQDEYGVKHYDKFGNEVFDDTPGRSHEEIERDQVEMLKKEVEEARKKYAAADYGEDKKNSWFKGFFGKKLLNVSIDTKQAAYEDYKEKLKDFSNYEIEKLKKGNFGPEELNDRMEELIKYFNTDEKLNLYEARTNARTEDWEGSIGGNVMKKAGDFTNWYRKQNVWTKGAVGAALSVSGIAVGAFGLGAAAASVVGVGIGGMRIMGGASAGVGTAAYLEARHRANESSTADEKIKEVMIQLEGKEADEKFKSLMDNLDLEMNSYGDSLEDEKARANTRRAIGIGVGAFIGSGAMAELFKGGAHFLKDGAHMIADTEIFKSATHHVADSEIVKTAASFWKEKLENIFDNIKPPMKEGVPHMGGVNHLTDEMKAAEFRSYADNGGSADIASNHPVNSTAENVFSTKPPLSESASHMGGVNHLTDEMKAAEFRSYADNGGSADIASNHPVNSTAENVFSTKPPLSESASHMGGVNHLVSEMQGEDPDFRGYLNNEAKILTGEVAPDRIDLELKKGSSLEGTLIKHLRASGMDAHEAGIKAHNEALKYAKEHGLKNGPYSLIHQGAHIEIDSSGKILNISGDSKLGYLQHHDAARGVRHDAIRGHAGVSSENHPSSGAQKVVSHERPNMSHPVRETTEAQLPRKPEAGVMNGNESPYKFSDRTFGSQEGSILPSDHSYESFSSEVDSSIHDLVQKNDEILSHFSELKSMPDVMDRIKYLENNISHGVPSDSMDDRMKFTFWKEDLEELKALRDNMTEMYRRTTHAMLEIENSSDSAIFDMNASQYLIEHPDGKAARIFSELKKTLGPAKMRQYGLNPNPSDNLLSWSSRVAKFVLKNKIGK